MAKWTFITNHGLVLVYIARHPRSTARDIASAVNVTERAVHRVITDLEAEGYIERRRVGRNNEYQVKSQTQLRHDIISDVMVEDFLDMLGWRRDW